MLTIKKEGIILKKTNAGFENDGVLNPTVIKNGENTHLFYRALRKGNYSSIGYCKLKNYTSVEDRLNISVIFPLFEYEKIDIEDQRIITVDDAFFLFNTTNDFKTENIYPDIAIPINASP